MKFDIIASLVGFIIMFGRNSGVAGCTERLGKGVVMCEMKETGNIDSFDFTSCTHAHIGTTTFLCTPDVCWPNNSTDFEETVRWMRPHLPGKIGLRIEFNQDFTDVIPTRLKRIKSAKRVINFMEERGFTFVIFQEDTQSQKFRDGLERNSLKFIEEIALAIHNRDWNIGLALNVGTTELTATYDFEALSQYVDWFLLIPVKYRPDENYIEPLQPISSTFDKVGTTEYWIEYMLQRLKPECMLIHVYLMGVKFTAAEVAVEPGPRSKAQPDSRSYVYISDVCETIEVNSCRSHWDEDTSTPWAACGDDYYTYVDTRSLKLTTHTARRFKLAGMSIRVDKNSAAPKNCGHKDPFAFLSALQGIRNITD